MFADFEKAFFKKNEIDKNIPEEILKALSEKLPEGFAYTNIGNGAAGITTEGTSKVQIKGQIKLPDDLDLPGNFKPSTMKELMEFIYRTQHRLKLKRDENNAITINGESFSIDEFISFPFEDMKVSNSMELTVIPTPFQPPFEVSIEGNGIVKKLSIQRQPYPDMNKSLFKSINNNSFKISYFLYETENKLQFKFDLNIDNANSVEESIEALKLYESCIKGEFKLHGERFSMPDVVESEKESISATIAFWEKALKLEQISNVKFTPKSQILVEEVVIIEELYRSLIEKKPFKEYIQLTDLTINGFEGTDINNFLEIEGLSFQFTDRSSVSALGVELELDSVKGFFDFKVTDTEPVKEDKTKIKLIVEPIQGKKIYQSTIYFCNEEELLNYRNNFDLTTWQNAELITID
ncbi:abortive infection system toxin AbiGii family protein [Peribacillus loiseleuriae]|uniref:Abortive phage resistance protein n=1 Tax=Peribacillus loiseleuriae TaxID=1679170 RepID=A0A0K9GTS2_9BACI|nr:abortive infection system toxin AbiGii family protein [Peribacillus loiseleuriae]KMY50084.1 hypothetical protein AC625_11715 [Peribacillus loiseleuriae]